MATTTGVFIFILLPFLQCNKANELVPKNYIFLPVGDSVEGCNVTTGGYNQCPHTAPLLDTVNGPRLFSQSTVDQYYTQFTNGGRTLFSFLSEVDIEVVQVYYYAFDNDELSEQRSRISLTFYSIEDNRYVPRLPIPQGAQRLGFTQNFNISGEFNTVCFNLNSRVRNLLVAMTITRAELHASEIKFFSSEVSERVQCKEGVYLTQTIDCFKALDRNCQKPVPGYPGPNSAVVYKTEQEATSMARCYAACLQDQVTNGTVKFSESEASWPSVGVSELPCGRESISQVLECARGCFVLAQNKSDADSCEDTCNTECESLEFETYRGSTCPVICQRAACQQGCRIYQEAIADKPVSRIAPAKPLSLFRQVSNIEAGVFSIKCPVPPKEVLDDPTATAFVLKVESKSKLGYLALTSLEEDLDLGEFACQKVSVSYFIISTSLKPSAPGNEVLFDPILDPTMMNPDPNLELEEISSTPSPTYSPFTEICVHGDSYANQLITGVGLRNRDDILEDLREEFRGSARAQLPLEWRLPSKGLEHVTMYEIILKQVTDWRPHCGKLSKNYIVRNRESTSLLLTADSVDDSPAFSRGDAPADACAYSYQFVVHPLRRGNVSFRRIIPKLLRDTVRTHEFELSCAREVNRTTGLLSYTFNWSINPPDLPFDPAEALENLRLFLIEISVMENGDVIQFGGVRYNTSVFETKTLSYNLRNRLLSAVATLQPNVSGSFQIGEMEPSFVRNFVRFDVLYEQTSKLFYRHRPSAARCELDATPLPPDPVNATEVVVAVSELTQDSELTVRLTWTVPETTYGPVQRFEYRITTSPVNSDAEATPDQLLFPSRTIEPPQPFLMLDGEAVRFVDESTLCVFFQVRVSNSFINGSWSESVPLPRNSSVNPADCTLIPSAPTVNVETLGESIMLPVWAYILIVIIIVLLILFAWFVTGMALKRKPNEKAVVGYEDLSQGQELEDIYDESRDPQEIPHRNLLLVGELGRGHFSIVYKGFLRAPRDGAEGLERRSSTRRTVAVKMLKEHQGQSTPADTREFLKEIEITRKIAERTHPNVVKMIGFVTSTEPFFIVNEYVALGSLTSFLLEIRAKVAQEYKKIHAYLSMLTANEPQRTSLTTSASSPAKKKPQTSLTTTHSYPNNHKPQHLTNSTPQDDEPATNAGPKGSSHPQTQLTATKPQPQVLSLTTSTVPSNPQPQQPQTSQSLHRQQQFLVGATPTPGQPLAPYDTLAGVESNSGTSQPCAPYDTLAGEASNSGMFQSQPYDHLEPDSLVSIFSQWPLTQYDHLEPNKPSQQPSQPKEDPVPTTDVPPVQPQSQLPQPYDHLEPDSHPLSLPPSQPPQNVHDTIGVVPSMPSQPQEQEDSASVDIDLEEDEEEQPILLSVTPSPDSSYASLGKIEPAIFISFAHQIASGMEFLSGMNIVHRDLACRNILLTNNKVLKISDFGLSRVLPEDDSAYVLGRDSNRRLPAKWMALESLDNRFPLASDVWMYGVTLWEMVTLGREPYDDVSNEEIQAHLVTGNRLECPTNCSEELYDLMFDCWDAESSNRPTFTELKQEIHSFLQNSDENTDYVQFPSQKELLKSQSGTYVTIGNLAKDAPDPTSQRLTPSIMGSGDVHIHVPVSVEASTETLSNSQDIVGSRRSHLEVEDRIQRHRSAPLMEGEEWNWELAPREARRRTLSNAYVRTPKRDKHQVRESFVWALGTPDSSGRPALTVTTEEN